MKIGVNFWLESTNKGAEHRRTPRLGGFPLGPKPIGHDPKAGVTPDAASRRAVPELQSGRGLNAAPCTRALSPNFDLTHTHVIPPKTFFLA
jgi:hypothetical protein